MYVEMLGDDCLLKEHLFRNGFLTDDCGLADVTVSVSFGCNRSPCGDLLLHHDNQWFYRDIDKYIYVQYTERTGYIWGSATSPFRHIQIYCEKAQDDIFVYRIVLEVFLQLAKYRFLYINRWMIHSSAVVIPQKGCIGFIGASGDGKSTQAKLWNDYTNAYILNDDKPIVEVFDKVYLSGSPWSGKSCYYRNERHVLNGLFVVKKSEHNAVEKLSIRDAYAYLRMINVPFFINKDIEKRYDRLMESLAQNVPVYMLECRPDKEAVSVVAKTVFGKDVCGMRIRKEFVLRRIADEWLVVAKGNASLDFRASILLNDVSAYLWKLMSEKDCDRNDLVQALLNEYDVSVERAEADVDLLIKKMREFGVME